MFKATLSIVNVIYYTVVLQTLKWKPNLTETGWRDGTLTSNNAPLMNNYPVYLELINFRHYGYMNT